MKLLPIGNGLPRITFDFRSLNSSIDHLSEFSTITRTVSWNDAAESQLAHSFAT
ncbi:hypothetical protein KBB05_04325 [Patescibacteria group bacterium]|nr:hypothetical protein [Patescibacteria group bacterium]